tara:strand:+ start:586 stop:1845 length:1260 start_codon:yes stop_codon:yes gene_type:complete
MAADSTLVEGAYRANRYMDLGERAAKQKLGETLGKINIPVGGKEKDSKSSKSAPTAVPTGDNTVSPDPYSNIKDNEVNLEEINEIEQEQQDKDQKDVEVQKQVDEGVSTTTTDEENVAGDLDDLREDINEAILGDDKVDAARIMNNVGQLKEDKDGVELALAHLGDNYNNKGNTTAHGYGMNLENNPEAKTWMQDLILSKEKMSVQEDADGNLRYGVYGPDGKFMTPNQLEEYLVQFEVDNTSFNAIDEMRDGYIAQAEEGTTSFDREQAKAGVLDIINKGNIQSLMHDSHFGGRSFVDDLMSSDEMNGISYASLGIKPPKGDKDGRIDPNDPIDKNLKRQIVNAFTTSKDYEDKAKEALVEYYTGYLERNYNRRASGIKGNDRFDLFQTSSDYTNRTYDQRPKQSTLLPPKTNTDFAQ